MKERSEPLSVFLLTRSLSFGGAERQLVELARGLQDRGHRVTVVTFYAGGPLAAELAEGGVPLMPLYKRGRWEVLRFLWRLRGAIRCARPDVLYTFVGGANIFGALVHPFIPGTRLVWSIRASDMDLTQYDWVHRLAYVLECRLSRVPNLIIANSSAGVEFAVSHGFPRERIKVVHNGIDTGRFRPDPELRQLQRAKWGLSDQLIAIGMLARLDAMKGHRDFIRAAAQVSKRHDNVVYLCIGEGKEEGPLKRLADELGLTGKILFVGPTDDPTSALNGLDVFCSASITEGFANAIAEAMACGLPCVITDVGDSAMIAGDFALVVPPSDPRALAHGIETQIDALGRGDPSQARARIVENFSIEAMIDSTLTALDAVRTD